MLPFNVLRPFEAAVWAAVSLISILAVIHPGHAATIDVDERRNLPVLINVPRDSDGPSISDLLRACDEAVSSSTDLRIVAADAKTEVSHCASDVPCIVHTVVPNIDEPTRPNFLLYLRLVEGRRLVSLLIDVEKVYEAAPNATVKPEATTLRRAVMLATLDLEERMRAAELKKTVSSLFSVHFRSALERAGHFDKRATLVLSGLEAGLTVTLDGQTIGTTSTDNLEITGVTSGMRKVGLTGAHVEPWTKSVDLAPASSVDIAVELTQKRSTALTTVRWSGVAVAGIGAAISIITVATPAPPAPEHCVGPMPECGAVGFRTFPAATADDPNRKGVLIAPLGYSLIAAGAVVAGWSWLEEDASRWWLWALTGLAAGAASYGISAAVNPD